MKRACFAAMMAILFPVLAACQPVRPVEPTISASRVETFVEGATLPGIMDMDMGADGNIYVATELSGAIKAVDPVTGEIVWEIDTGNDVPEAVRIAPDGRLYWTSFYSLNVCSLSSAGEKKCQAMPKDVWGLAFSEDGRLFVAANEHVQDLYEVDPELTAEPRKLQTIGALMGHFNFGPDGKLYVPMVGDGTILRVDVDKEPITVETVAEGLLFPWSVAFDQAGNLYAAVSIDDNSSAVARVDLATGESTIIGQVPAGYNTVAVTGDGRVLTGLYDDGDIYEILADGSANPLTEPGMIAPGGLAVLPRADGGESLFVADWKTLREYDTQTAELRNVWHGTMFPGSMFGPRTVAGDGEQLLISSWADAWSGNALQEWDPVQGQATTTTTDFQWPVNAVPFQGETVYVDIQSPDEWRVVRATGDELSERTVLGDEMLEHPLGLAATGDDLWVADYGTGYIWRLVADGVELSDQYDSAGPLDRPEGMAFAPDGRLLVVETGTGRLVAIDPASGEVDTIAEGLGFAERNVGSVGPVSLPPHLVFNGIAVDSAGNVYVSGDAANVIYRIALAP